MSVKLTLVDAFREAGYDFITACELAQETIDDFLRSSETVTTIGIMSKGKAVRTFELRKPNR